MSSSSGGPKPTKACVNCRRQKIKCILDDGASSCRRCQSNEIPCVFIPRANAAAFKQALELQTPKSVPKANHDPTSILGRLEVIENMLGISQSSESKGIGLANSEPFVSSPTTGADSPLRTLSPALATLKNRARRVRHIIWSDSIVNQLWHSFQDNVPGLHFLSRKQTFTSPTPLLLAAILYVSALQHPSDEIAALATDYFIVMCDAIADLTRPSNSPVTDSNAIDEQSAFQDILGLILGGLVCEAFINTTGMWISMGFRLLLDHCPVRLDERSPEWKGLFIGLQTIDLEHASLHLTCPILPRSAPLPALLNLPTEDPYCHLTELMHIGLGHFIGRGLPTIWSFVFSTNADSIPSLDEVFSFTENDSAVIRQWAKQLDSWLARYGKSPNQASNVMVFRQYCLHRLFVLSIYHPARGFDLFSHSTASAERSELLVSARAALRLHVNDSGIWGNWDLTIITWAALLVLQGMQGGSSEENDFHLIQTHLLALQNTHQPPPSVRHQLASRLESSLQSMRTPPAVPNPSIEGQIDNDEFWSLFDQDSILSWPDFSQASNIAPTNEVMSSSIPIGGDIHGAATQSGDAWPPTLMRFFGNGDYAMQDGAE